MDELVRRATTLHELRIFIDNYFFSNYNNPTASDLAALETAVKSNKSFDQKKVAEWVDSLWKKLFIQDFGKEYYIYDEEVDKLSLKPGNPYTYWKRKYEYMYKTNKNQRVLKGHLNSLKYIHFNDSGDQLISQDNDWQVKVWNMNTLDVKRSFDYSKSGLQTGAANIRDVTSDGKFMLISNGGDYILVEIDGLKRTFKLLTSNASRYQGRAEFLMFRKNRNKIYALYDTYIYVWDISKLPETRSFLQRVFLSKEELRKPIELVGKKTVGIGSYRFGLVYNGYNALITISSSGDINITNIDTGRYKKVTPNVSWTNMTYENQIIYNYNGLKAFLFAKDGLFKRFSSIIDVKKATLTINRSLTLPDPGYNGNLTWHPYKNQIYIYNKEEPNFGYKPSLLCYTLDENDYLRFTSRIRLTPSLITNITFNKTATLLALSDRKGLIHLKDFPVVLVSSKCITCQEEGKYQEEFNADHVFCGKSCQKVYYSSGAI